MMNIRTSIKIAGIITALISAFVFIGFRAFSLDKSYIKYRAEETADIRKDYNSFFTARELEKDQVAFFLKTVMDEYPDISIIIIKGGDGRPILMSVNDRLRADEPLYKEIREDAFAQPVMNDMTIASSSKYYFSRHKYYLLSARCDKGSLSLAFPRKMPFPLALRLSIETILVVVLVGLFFGFIYFLIKRRYASTGVSAPAPDIGKKSKKGSSYSDDAILLSVIESISIDLNAPDVILSFIGKISKRIERTIGCKNRRLYSSLPSDSSSSDIRREILDELSKGSNIMRNKGKRVLTPIFRKGTLSGVMIVSRSVKFSGTELKKIEHYTAGIGHNMKD